MTIGLDQTATVYGRDGSGAYTVVLTAMLPCRLVRVRGTSPDQQGRAELARMRRLLWDPSYIMPAHSQVEVDDGGATPSRWNVLEGSQIAPRLLGSVHHRSVDVISAAGSS